MHKSASSFNKETSTNNIVFLSLAIPLCVSLWMSILLFDNYINPRDFINLPQNIREEHITSLFFRADHFLFPISLTKNIGNGVPLSLTDTIPLIAIIFKIFNINTMQYFGIWILLSYTLFVFFAHRISKNIFPNPIATGLGSLLFLSLPVIWYHTFYIPWFSGQWVVLWAFSLFFKKKSFASLEWYSVMIFATLIHPSFTLICFLIMLADIFHLYIYNHTISSLVATATVSHLLTVTILALGIVGTFYLPSFRIYSNQVQPLSFTNSVVDNYNMSFLDIGLGCIIGFIFSLFLIISQLKVKLYIKFYTPLLLSMIILFLFSTSGGLKISHTVYRYSLPNSWLTVYLLPIFTSGPRYFIPILYLIPITIIYTAHNIEKTKPFLGMLFLTICLSIQVMTFSIHTRPKKTPFVALDNSAQEFVATAKHFKWIYPTQLPYRPHEFETLAYYAFVNNISINVAPVIRFPTLYKNTIQKDAINFINKHFQPYTIYVLEKKVATAELSEYGSLYTLPDMILFKPFVVIPTS